LSIVASSSDQVAQEQRAMPLLVTSAAGANGDGYGLLLAFDRDGTPLGSFGNDERIADRAALQSIRSMNCCS
jgi:hypothetical protein